jgi:glycosyltransferase involved in cell wall biosynthesis
MTNILDPDVVADAAGTLRIGLFSESFEPVQNGVTTSVLTLMAGLRARNHHVWVFAPAHQQQREPETNVLRFPSFVSLFNRDYPIAYPLIPRLALSSHFSRLRLDVVHTHTPFVLGLTGANLALSRGVPLVTTFHTLYTQYTHYVPLLPDAVTHSFLEYYLPWYYNRCALIICPSEVAASFLRRQGVERPMEIIPTGIPLPAPESVSAEARRCTRERLGIAPETPLLLYTGRLAPEKNMAWLLEVFVAIRARVPAARLVIAGGGPSLDELQTQAEMLLGDAVVFLGPTPRSQLDALYAAADVFCFPSPSETQGLVIGEARAAGTPCVVVDAGGAPETVRDGNDGFRIPVGDKEMFVDRVAQIVQNERLRERLRANALRNACDFTPETMVQRVLGVYERASQQAPPSSAEPQAGEMDWEAVVASPGEPPGDAPPA